MVTAELPELDSPLAAELDSLLAAEPDSVDEDSLPLELVVSELVGVLEVVVDWAPVEEPEAASLLDPLEGVDVVVVVLAVFFADRAGSCPDASWT